MTGEGPTRVRATELFDREFLGRLLRVLQQVQQIEQEGRQQSPPDGAKGFWARPGFSFSIPSVRLLRELLLGISAIYFAESVVYLLSGGPYVVPISTLIGCLTFHSGYWTLRERRFPGWLGVPLALLSLLIAGLALLFNHGLILPYFHAVFVLPLVFVYLCGQVASIVITISFLLFFLVVLFSPFPGMEGQLSMPVMERVLILLLFQLSALCSWLYNRWMQRVFSNYQGQMGTITSLLGLQGEAVEVLSAALRTEQGNMRAVLGLAHERPITPQRLAEIVDTIERLGGDLRRVVDSMDCLRILTQAQDSVEASSWALGTAEDMDEQFDLKTLVVSRLKSNLLLRNARILVDYAFDPSIPLRLAGDAVALRGAIDLITQGMLRDYLRPSSLLFVHSQLLGGEQGDRVQVLLRFRCVESYRIGGGQTRGIYGRERVDYSSLPPLGEPRQELQGGARCSIASSVSR